MYSICQSVPLISFLLLFVAEPGNGIAQDVRKLGRTPCPRTPRAWLLISSSFPSKMILDVVKSFWLMFKKSCWRNDGIYRRTQYFTFYIHTLSESGNPPCSNGSRKYRAKCNDNRLDSRCSLVPPRGRTQAHFPNSGW